MKNVPPRLLMTRRGRLVVLLALLLSCVELLDRGLWHVLFPEGWPRPAREVRRADVVAALGDAKDLLGAFERDYLEFVSRDGPCLVRVRSFSSGRVAEPVPGRRQPDGSLSYECTSDLLVDGWGKPILWRAPGPLHPNGLDVWSCGPDETDENGRGDDIIVGENIASVGTVR